MFPNLKPLVVALAAAWTMFYLLRPLCLACMSSATFARRRMVWYALTVVAFLCPSYGLYTLFAIGLLLWAGNRETNPLGLYVLLAFVIPNVSYYIPTVLIGQLFDVTHYRSLSLFILVPWIIRSRPRWRAQKRRGWTMYDMALAAFLSIFVLTNVPYQSGSATIRQGFLYAIDSFVVFYAFSRLESREQLADVMASLIVSTGVMALVAIVEWSKGWLIYTGLAGAWGQPFVFAFLFRGDRLRAQAAANGPLNLGYHLALGLAMYACLRTRMNRKLFDVAVIAIFAIGLYSTASRGPWLTAIIALLLFSLSRPNAFRRLAGVTLGCVFVLAVLYVTPLKESVIDRMPIIGNADQDTIEYRQQLADLSWTIIDRHPWLGDPFAPSYMESMRQGQGIIDIVNGYLWTLLFTGWVGMSLQAIGFVGALGKSAFAMFRVRAREPVLGSLGAGLIACFLATLFFIATAGYGPTTYMLMGLLMSYAWVAGRQAAQIEQGNAKLATPLAVRTGLVPDRYA